jgi:glutaredoxin
VSTSSIIRTLRPSTAQLFGEPQEQAIDRSVKKKRSCEYSKRHLNGIEKKNAELMTQNLELLEALQREKTLNANHRNITYHLEPCLEKNE